MYNQTKLPKKIPVFPLSNFIFFPNTSAPLNIFEPRYIQMIDDSMKSDRIIGMIQPKKSGNIKKPDLFSLTNSTELFQKLKNGNQNSRVVLPILRIQLSKMQILIQRQVLLF